MKRPSKSDNSTKLGARKRSASGTDHSSKETVKAALNRLPGKKGQTAAAMGRSDRQPRAAAKDTASRGRDEEGSAVEAIRSKLLMALDEQTRIEESYLSLVQQQEDKLNASLKHNEFIGAQLRAERDAGAALRTHRDQLQQHVASLTSERERAEAALNEISSQFAERSTQSEMVSDELTRARGELAELRANLEDAERRAAASEAASLASWTKIADASQRIADLAAQLQAERASAGELKSLSEEVRHNITSLRIERDSLREALKSKHDELGELQAKYSRVLQHSAEQEDSIIALLKQSQESELSLSDVQAQFSSLREVHAVTEADLRASSNKISELLLELERGRRDAVDEKGRFEALRDELDIERKSVSEIAISASNSQRVLHVTLLQEQAERTRAEARLHELETQLKNLDIERARTEASLAQTSDQVQAARTHAETLQTELAALAATYSHAVRDLERARLELAPLKKSRFFRLRKPFLAFRRALGAVTRRALLRQRLNPLFDATYYLESYPDVREAGVDPYSHYLKHGARDGRNPNLMFDTRFYLERYPDVAESGTNPLVHFVENGAAELRDPHPLFSTQWYLQHTPGLAQSGENPLAHYLATLRRAESGI